MNLSVNKLGLNNRAITFGDEMIEGGYDKTVEDYIDNYKTIPLDYDNKLTIKKALGVYNNPEFFHARALIDDFTKTGTIEADKIGFWLGNMDEKVKVAAKAATASNTSEFLDFVQVHSKKGAKEFEEIKKATKLIHENPFYKQVHKLSTELSETKTIRQTTMQRAFSTLRPNKESTIAMVSQFGTTNPIDAKNKKILADSMNRLTKNDFFINASDIVDEFKRTSKVKDKSIGLAIGDAYSGYNHFLGIDYYANSASEYAKEFYLFTQKAQKPLSRLQNTIVRMERNKHLIEAANLLKIYDKNGKITNENIEAALKNLKQNKLMGKLKNVFKR